MKPEPISIRFYAEQAGQSIDLSVLSLQYVSRIHHAYDIKIDVVDGDGSQSTFDMSPTGITQQWGKVLVTFHQTGQTMCLQGLVKTVIAIPYQQRLRILRMTLGPELWPMLAQHRSGIYYSPTLKDVLNLGIQDQAQQTNAANYTDFQFKLSSDTNRYPTHFQLTQYQETDGAFLARTIKRHGAWFNFYQPLSASVHDNANKVTLVVGDNNAVFERYPNTMVLLNDTDQHGNGISQFRYQMPMTVNAVKALYFDEESGQTFSSSQSVCPSGMSRNTDIEVPFNHLTQGQVECYAQTLAEGLRLRQKPLSGYFQGHLIQAGNIVDLDTQYYGIKGDCIVTEVCYRFTPDTTSTSSNKLMYQQQHSFKGFPLAEQYRESLSNDTAPVYDGVMSGVFAETHGKDTVTPDEQGRVPLKLPLDYSHFCNGAKARYTRLSLPLNSGDAGMSFPYYADTEFQLVFANGNLDKPLIVGTAATGKTRHIHSDTLQQRTSHTLPQGQELTYTNTLGNTTAMKFGVKHQEGDHHSFMMLNNYPSATRPGDKHLDFVQATTANSEHQVSGNLTEKFGGNKVQGAVGKALQNTNAQLVKGMPNVSMTLPAYDFNLAPIYYPRLILKPTLTLSGTFSATSDQQMSTVEFEGRKASLCVDAKQALANSLEQEWGVSVHMDSLQNSTLSLSNEITGALGTISCTINGNELSARYSSVPIKKTISGNWTLEGICNIVVTAKIYKIPPKTSVSDLTPQSLTETIKQFLITIGDMPDPVQIATEQEAVHRFFKSRQQDLQNMGFSSEAATIATALVATAVVLVGIPVGA